MPVLAYRSGIKRGLGEHKRHSKVKVDIIGAAHIICKLLQFLRKLAIERGKTRRVLYEHKLAVFCYAFAVACAVGRLLFCVISAEGLYSSDNEPSCNSSYEEYTYNKGNKLPLAFSAGGSFAVARSRACPVLSVSVCRSHSKASYFFLFISVSKTRVAQITAVIIIAFILPYPPFLLECWYLLSSRLSAC